ncbi:MAG: hypothetical protein IK152_07185 [Lachnospiraceae bacterium]|nr:hypothetical protein [Lachnospiraceae bacterium]
MQEEREISLRAVFYTILKKWKLLIILFAVIFIAGYGFFWFRARKAAGADGTTNAANATNVADVVEDNEVEKTKQHALDYKDYLEKSEFMKIDTNALHNRIIYYVINWKESGLSGDAYENKSATLYGLLSAIFPSQELKNAIESYNSEYAGRSLDELISIGRSGNTVYFVIMYSDDSYVKDLEDIIAKGLASKADAYKALVGDYELVSAQEIDRAVDGTNLKNAQNTKKTNLTNLEKEIGDLEKRAATTTTSGGGAKGLFIGIKNTLICLFIGLFVALGIGFLIAVFGKKFNSATDVSDQMMKDVICIFKAGSETGLDKMYYKKNDKYHYPRTYLSILAKNMEEAGLKKLYLYNCSGADVSAVEGRITEIMDNVEVVSVPQERDNFYLEMTESDGAVMLVKGGDTRRSELSRMRDHLDSVKANWLGTIFVV